MINIAGIWLLINDLISLILQSSSPITEETIPEDIEITTEIIIMIEDKILETISPDIRTIITIEITERDPLIKKK